MTIPLYASLTRTCTVERVEGRVDTRGQARVEVHAMDIYLSLDAEGARELAARLLAATEQAERLLVEVRP